ncbi:type II toxin-antitoxin system VapC family toxin [Cupriavidus taiwanensis]|uniref:type II toxin-antitoxin system VapC family toxin n=1 Tax=Cupriavidus taiwanensis TaxID=164546 RepID=UPI000E17D70C|nr:type II toxin-antitoxin system VapC family toxin [Cupriavidus taiwanensis]SOZ33647.1 VapC ribonuclease Y4jK [Cupriavidus taiwanensis]SPA38465.1 VapC ribonuclease Y4jK [Cupriavidus taiwanensis]
MIVLDTNVLSELMRVQAEPAVVCWLDRQEQDFVVTAVTVAELLYGIARLPEGRRKTALRDAALQMLDEEFADRLLAFDADAAVHYAALVSRRERAGRPISMADAQIAAICLNHAATLATRNTRDFEGVDIRLANPWSD